MISKNLERRLAAYGSLAAAAISMPAAAQAGAVSWYPDLSTANGPIYFDPFSAAGYAGTTPYASDFELLTSVQGASGSLLTARLLVSPGNAGPNGNEFAESAASVARLAPEMTVGASLAFSSVDGTLAENHSPAFGLWNPVPEAGVLGFELVSGGPTLYGWADITVNSDYTITLQAFGYDDSGAAVTALPPISPTPEPASIVLLALGAAGIAAWRRKKTKTPASAE
jgi:hypothetical protein